MSSARHAGSTQEVQAAAGPSLMEAVKTAARLVPRQLNDELNLAKEELKHKGIRIGIAAGFLVAALIFVCLMVTALVVAAVAGLSMILPQWLAALVIAAFFLLIVLICGLVGWVKIKKAMPLAPADALMGLRHDLGIAKEGRAFDPTTLVKEPLTKDELKARKAEKAAKAARAKAEREAKEAADGPLPTEKDLRSRTSARREHLILVREQILAEANVKKQTSHLLGQAREQLNSRMGAKAQDAGASAANMADAAKERWVPLSVLAVSGTALAVLLRKLFKK